MNPSIHITNRRTAEAVARTLRERNRAGAFLSIHGTDEETPDLSTPGGSSCCLCFDDVEDDSVPGCTPMSDVQSRTDDLREKLTDAKTRNESAKEDPA